MCRPWRSCSLGRPAPAHKYAAHRLLSEDRTFFKQTNRSPARFQPRPETEVRSLVMKAEALAKVVPSGQPCAS